MKISFDFDSTLSTKRVQDLAAKFISLGADVYVTTSRPSSVKKGMAINNNDLFDVTNALGICKSKVRFTHYKDKYTFLKDFDLHFDDDDYEIQLINQHPSKCYGVLINPNNNLSL